MKEFAFDVMLSAVLRLKANSIEEAREAVECLESEDECDFGTTGVKMTEFTVITAVDGITPQRAPHCFEIDGVNQDEDRHP